MAILTTRNMKILGVTGGIGSGKSAVCALLAEKGARIFYADAVAKRLQLTDERVRGAILDAFGAEAYLADGSLNRAYLAGRVFSSDEDRRRINAIVHPAVARAFEEAVEAARRDGVPLLVKEAALLLDTDTSLFDAIVVVDAPAEERIRRVTERDGVDPDAVRARIAGQMAPEEMAARADVVLVNDGSLEDLKRKVDRLFEAVLAG